MAVKAQEKSRGRKQCPNCGTFVGVRTKVCSCGYEFPMKTKQVAEVVASE